MKIVAISDIHGQLPEEPCPECDILILAGDICPERPHVQPRAEVQAEWLDTTFRKWLLDQPAKKIIATWGNHDFVGQQKIYPNDLPWTLLVDDSIMVDGFMIYCTPWVPNLGRWAFATEGDVPSYYRYNIPLETDILVSHGPPFGYCDKVLEGMNVGSETLLNRINDILPTMVICGHIHEARGEAITAWGHKIINVASVDRGYQPYPERYTVIKL